MKRKNEFLEVGKSDTKKLFKQKKKNNRLEITLIVILTIICVMALMPYFLKR